MRRALANAAAAAAARSGATTTIAAAVEEQTASSPLAAAAAVARVLMRASHATRAAAPIALQYHPGFAGVAASGSPLARAFSSSATTPSSSSPSPATASQATSPTKNDPYDVRITLRAYDLRFLEEAACAVQDLVLINLSPKPARDLLGTASDGAARAALRDGHGVAFPCLGAATPPKQRTLYSLIRSPHKYKTSFEQFERVAHRRVVSASTRDHDEVQWLLACLRFYQFTGVEVEVSVTSAPTYLLPAAAAVAAEGDAVAASGLNGSGNGSTAFAAHRARFAALFDDAAAALAASGGGEVAGEAKADVERQREAVAAALKGLRAALSGGGAGGAEEAAAASASSSPSKPQHPLLAAVDRVMGGLDVDALVREELDRRRGEKRASSSAGASPAAASLLSIPPDLLTARKKAAGDKEASSAPSDEATAADWLYAAMEKQKKQQEQQQQQSASAPAAVPDEQAALAAAREQYARFAAALQVALLRGWAARVEGA